MATALSAQKINVYYGASHALQDVSLDFEAGGVTALIGPSGCGKSTFLRCLNRMNDLIPNVKITGSLLYRGEDIYAPGQDVTDLRKRIGMVFQKANPFPMSIYDNVAYGPRTHGIRSKVKLDEIVEESLKGAAIWDEVKDRLKKPALGLSGGQQQRLCIARALAVKPDVLLMDESTSALDPISTSKIEDLATELKKDYTIIMVTHNMHPHGLGRGLPPKKPARREGRKDRRQQQGHKFQSGNLHLFVSPSPLRPGPGFVIIAIPLL